MASRLTVIDESNFARNQTEKDILDQVDDEILAIRNAFNGKILFASESYNAGSIADGDEEVGEITVTGAALGDFCLASLSIDVADLGITAAVTAADTVTYQLWNNTGGAIDLGAATVYVLVIGKPTVNSDSAALVSKVLAKT